MSYFFINSALFLFFTSLQGGIIKFYKIINSVEQECYNYVLLD